MWRIIITSILLAFAANTFASEWEAAKLIRAAPSNYAQGKARVTFRVPSIVPLNYWYTCNFYNRNSEVIASARHVLRERVPSTTIVLSNPEEIFFILCKKG